MTPSLFGTVARCLTPLLAAAALVGAPPALADDGNPLGGMPFYVDPISKAMHASNAQPDSAELARVANTPQAYWLDQAFGVGSVGSTVARPTRAGAGGRRLRGLVRFGIPHRDCGSYAAGGFSSGASYRAWIDSVADGIGGNPAAIGLEPDALAVGDCLSGGQRQERVDLISYAVDTLGRNPATAVYVDAGHSRWVSAGEMANRLNQAGVGRARGFALNSTNYFTTEEETGYGEEISGMTGGAHYVIDTSRNGAGPAEGDPYSWCNPSGRALGTPPTANTAGQHADAYLWVKRVGESDGSCGSGEPAAGHFVSDYAINLARNAG